VSFEYTKGEKKRFKKKQKQKKSPGIYSFSEKKILSFDQ
jgi:hypothetical protein